MTEVRGLSLSPVVLPEVRREAGVELRKARLEDVDAIYWLIRYWAEKGLMLVRSHSHLYENIRDFWVLEDEDGQIVGTVALHVLWRDLAEIRGLAVHPTRQGQGLGRWLVLGAEREARDLGLPRVFAWTLQVNFFRALGYRVTSREALPPRSGASATPAPSTRTAVRSPSSRSFPQGLPGARMDGMGTLTRYLEEAMARARYELIADEEPYYGEIPDLPGVWATGKSLKECEANLQAALEDWLLFLLSRGETPALGRGSH